MRGSCVWYVWFEAFACSPCESFKNLKVNVAFFSNRANGAYRLYGVGKKRLAMSPLLNAER